MLHIYLCNVIYKILFFFFRFLFFYKNKTYIHTRAGIRFSYFYHNIYLFVFSNTYKHTHTYIYILTEEYIGEEKIRIKKRAKKRNRAVARCSEHYRNVHSAESIRRVPAHALSRKKKTKRYILKCRSRAFCEK